MEPNLQEQLNSYKKTDSKKKYIWVIIILALATAAAYYFLTIKEENGNEKLSYKTQELKKGNLQVTVMATGNLNPTNSVDIGIEVSGTIKEIYVDFNDKVEVGQILAKLDTTKLKSQVDSSKASLSVAKANMQQSEVTLKSKKLYYERMSKIYEQSKGNYPSQNDLDDARFAYENAEAAYKASQAEVNQADFNLKTDQENLEKAVVRSSIKGIVLNREIEIGQTVAASMSTPTLFTLAKDLTKMDLIVSIDEADVANIKEGLDVSFTVDAYPNETFKGKIKQVRYNPIENSGVITYETVASVDNEKLLLRPGMTASAKITTKELKGKLLVPNSALRFKPTVKRETKKQNGISFVGPPMRNSNNKRSKDLDKADFKTVYILENGQPKKVTVRVLETDGKFTSVESQNLKAGDKIIISQESE